MKVRILTSKGWSVLIGGGLVAAALIGAHLLSSDVLLVNESRSMPRGLYLRQLDKTARTGQIVAIGRPPAMRAYLASLRVGPDMLLLKRVAAIGGDPVCKIGQVVRLPARTIAVSAIDRRGTALPVWSDCRRLGAEELFLLGDTATSFDSRYFGPVRRGEVRGVYRQVLAW